MINDHTSQKEKSIVFIGFMGVGKTAIGECLAQKLARDFIDVDKEIEKEFNMPVREIFNSLGEKVFREKEKSMIQELCQQEGKIISLGGGAFLQNEIREFCLAHCTVIFLSLSWEAWKTRLPLIIDSRPVLQGRTMEEIEQLFYKRQEIYSTHHIKVETDHLAIEEIADSIIASLQLS